MSYRAYEQKVVLAMLSQRLDSHCSLQDSYPRFLKSDMYKGLLEEAVSPLETKRW